MTIKARNIYNPIRALLVTLLVAVALLCIVAWMALSHPSVQNRLKQEGEKQLSAMLKTNVTIDHVAFTPFNRITFYGVDIPDRQNRQLFSVERLGAGIDVMKLIVDRMVVVDYVVVDGLNGHIERPDNNSPTNMQFIIDAFKPKEQKEARRFDLSITDVVVRRSSLTYDVLNVPHETGRFDFNHMSLCDITADLALPCLRNDEFSIDVKRLAFCERSGLEVRNFSAKIELDRDHAVASGIHLRLPGTLLSPQNFSVRYDSLKHIAAAIKTMPLHLRFSNNTVTPSDFQCFVPQLSEYIRPVQISANVYYDKRDIHVNHLRLQSDDGHVSLVVNNGKVANVNYRPAMTVDLPHYQLYATSSAVSSVINKFTQLPAAVLRIIEQAGYLRSTGSLRGNAQSLDYDGTFSTDMGQAALSALAQRRAGNVTTVNAHFAIPLWNVGTVVPQSKIGQLSANGAATAVLCGTDLVSVTFKGDVPFVDYNGYRYHDITADVSGNGQNWQGSVAVNDPNGRFDVNGQILLAGEKTSVDADVKVSHFDPVAMRLTRGTHNICSLTGKINVTGNSFSTLSGTVTLSDMTCLNVNGKTYHLDSLELATGSGDGFQNITLKSDFIRGSIIGTYDLATLVPSFKGMLAHTFPNWFGRYAGYASEKSLNNFFFNFTLEPNEDFMQLIKLPVKVLYKVTAEGNLNVPDRQFNLTINAPYLQKGNSLIEGSTISASFDNESNSLLANLHTLVPSKNGKISVNLDAAGSNNQIDTDLGWRYNRQHDYHGEILLTSHLLRDMFTDTHYVQTYIKPSDIIVNDTVWQMQPGSFTAWRDGVKVDNIAAVRAQQSIKISGDLSKDSTKQLTLVLCDIDLDYVFETLNISNVRFGGRATGVFTASGLFNGSPVVETPNLHVEGIKYNNAVMGNANIKSNWDNATKAINIDADIAQHNGQHSVIVGQIFPTMDSLYFDFNAHRANVAFLKSFMSAFSSDVGGEVSGHAVLFGNFHTIDLYGDVFADSLNFKLDFTNTCYTCRDSVHMRPGRINFRNVRIYDRDSHTATLGGWLTHEQFHNPKFHFAITDAHDLLCFDTNGHINPRWYGTIYGNGSAFVDGVPGNVDIKLNLQSAPRSKFTFVLSDAEEAVQYDFITYRDRNRQQEPVVADTAVLQAGNDSIPDIVRQLARGIRQSEQSTPTSYQIDLQADVTPDLSMVLVMDPVGGDKIKATGNGNLHLTYGNMDEQLNMFGRYVLDKGSYNFTLQDIIIKDFTISSGSSITFQGDPYRAVLGIEAIYSLNANLSDLDASFASDRDFYRTNVPVHALLKANGEITQPSISFDLEFPTLTTEAYRKIKSIINTDDMMNRQIVYLLALNRFYTPDYMNNTTSGNELTSVASSTISSQLSNVLGQLSDNWSISPNFRSNKGDFSDTEFDLALSSQLLNNRILFNGNFGYRDNLYGNKNTKFNGDFDLEYLLNRQGTWRLKAYSHFNDQNYYLRNALTTQGVGIIFKHDFDSWRHIFRDGRKAGKQSAAPADSLRRSTKAGSGTFEGGGAQ